MYLVISLNVMHVHSFWAINIVKHSILCGWHFSFFQQIATEANWAKHTSAQWLNDMCRANYVTGWQTLILPGCRHPLAFWDRWTGENYASPVVKQAGGVLGPGQNDLSHDLQWQSHSSWWVQPWNMMRAQHTQLTSVTSEWPSLYNLDFSDKGPHFTI